MTVDEVYQFFGSARKAAKAINVTAAAFSLWLKKGRIPMGQQRKFEQVTKHILNARIEDTEPNISLSTYFPNFRYFDKKYGMVGVESIHFRKGERPKITYSLPGKKIEKLSKFNNENLMQAIDLQDYEGNILYEGDIILLKNKEKFVFKNIEMIHTIKRFGKFKIIGNIFE
jgi:DNA-binding transcriptional regulator Cro